MMNIDVPDKKIYSAMLPATSVTQSMRDHISKIAKQHNTSMAFVVRHALDIFLSDDDKQFINSDKEVTDKAGRDE